MDVALFSDAARQQQPPLLPGVAAITATPADAPAGGTGASGGCYDTANNRNAFITSINADRTYISTLIGYLQTAGVYGVTQQSAPDPALFSPERCEAVIPLTSLGALATEPTTPPAGGTGATAGGYDTAPNRDAAIVTINDLLDITESISDGLTALGLVGSAGSYISKALLSDAALAARPPLPTVSPSTTALPAAAPAGGTGADAGGWDTAGNRNTGIAAVAGMATIIGQWDDALVAAGLAT